MERSLKSSKHFIFQFPCSVKVARMAVNHLGEGASPSGGAFIKIKYILIVRVYIY